MKVVLKVTVLDRIVEQFNKARAGRQEVDHVVISHDEYSELRGDRRCMDYISSPPIWCMPSDTSVSQELTIRDFELVNMAARGALARPRYRAVSHETFMGAPLFVVHKDFCPR